MSSTDSVKDMSDLFLEILAWSFLPSIATFILHGLLRLFRLLPTAATPAQSERQKKILKTVLLVIYGMTELYGTYTKLPVSHYSTLNCAPNDMSNMKSTYRKLSLLYHPDKNSSPEAEIQFRKIRAAYDYLSDSMRNRVYYLMGHLDPTATATCKIYKDYLNVYAIDALPFYVSLMVAMSISLMMSKDKNSFGKKMLAILFVMSLDAGLVTGSYRSDLGFVPIFMFIKMMRKGLMVFCMLLSQVGGIWSIKPMAEKEFMDCLAVLREAKVKEINQQSSTWFNFAETEQERLELRQRASNIVNEIWERRKD